MSMIDSENLDQVRAPVATARGMPNAFYADADVFEAEKQAVFAANWACIGFASDVPGAGDVKPVDFLGQPYVIVRGKDDVVRVFENVCRHRGMILVEKPAHTNGIIRCPYHSWCYGLDGSLRTTPHVGGPGQVGRRRQRPVIRRVGIEILFKDTFGAHGELLGLSL